MSSSTNPTPVDQHILSERPLNSEPSLPSLVSHFITPTPQAFNRNHGDPLAFNPASYTLSISSEVVGADVAKSRFTFDEVVECEKTEIVAVLACAGNRRNEMDSEKKVEGLQWGGSAIANCRFGGALLRDVLRKAGLSTEKIAAAGPASGLHLHFETTQDCEQDSSYSVSVPVSIALDLNRPVLLAYEQNGERLEKPHGAPLRVVVPGVIGARSVKWVERIVLREHESDGFYQKEDYKVLPPEATSSTKADYMKDVPALMEYPLNAEICEPAEGDVLEIGSEKPPLTIRGYALGAHGIPISTVRVALVPLPVPPPPPASSSSSSSSGYPSNPEVLSSPLFHIRHAASGLPSSAWTRAKLVSTEEGEDKKWTEGEKNWGWTLWTAEVDLKEEVRLLAERAVGGIGAEVAIVAFAEDIEGNVQSLQTEWNLRGVAEASWSVARVKIRKAV